MSTPASLLKSMQTADGIGLTATKTTKHNQTAATKSTKPATKKKEKQTKKENGVKAEQHSSTATGAGAGAGAGAEASAGVAASQPTSNVVAAPPPKPSGTQAGSAPTPPPRSRLIEEALPVGCRGWRRCRVCVSQLTPTCCLDGRADTGSLAEACHRRGRN